MRLSPPSTEWLWESINPGEKAFAVEINTFGAGGNRLLDIGQISDGYDLVRPNGDGFRVGILRVRGEDLRVVKNAFLGVVLRPQESCEEKKYKIPQESCHVVEAL